MAKVDIGTAKYIVYANFEATGVVEKPDVIGAIFGQTEGLLGSDLELRELQRTGRIGRIDVFVSSKAGKSEGKITIPSSLDKVETAILAAAMESIEQVGPCEARVKVESIEDVRVEKRKKIIERAKELLRKVSSETLPDTLELTDAVEEELRLSEITEYGPEKLPAGPNINNSDAIVVVEGRADVLNLLKSGIKNVIAVGGTSIPETVGRLAKTKTVTAFLDGDRGGDLILKGLMQIAEIDFVARAPEGKEVEELTKKEIFKALRNKVAVEQITGAKKKSVEPEENGERKLSSSFKPEAKADEKIDGRRESFGRFFRDISGKFKAYLLDSQENIIKEVAVKELATTLENSKENVFAVIFDGIVTQRLVEISQERRVEYLVGAKMGNIVSKPSALTILTARDLGVE